MVEKIINNKDTIIKIIGKNANKLTIQYNLASKRAWFKTENMQKRLILKHL